MKPPVCGQFQIKTKQKNLIFFILATIVLQKHGKLILNLILLKIEIAEKYNCYCYDNYVCSVYSLLLQQNLLHIHCSTKICIYKLSQRYSKQMDDL